MLLSKSVLSFHGMKIACFLLLLSEEHPLVLVLDDLQWADCTSLKLIPLIVSGDDVRSAPSSWG